jgi:DNA-directed RNA polymerase specialized sigma24 family protein
MPTRVVDKPVVDKPSDERDAETVRLLASGDPDGLRRLLSDHAGSVLAVLAREFAGMLDRQQLEDALAEAVIRTWRAGIQAEVLPLAPGAWLYVIARNRARSLVDDRRRLEVVFVDDLDERPAIAPASSPELAVAADPDRLRDDMRRCLEGLPDNQRAVLAADLDVGGVAPAGPLAAALHTTRSAIYVARHFGRRALREALRRCGYAFDERARIAVGHRSHS